MSTKQTEMVHASAFGFDLQPPDDALKILAASQVDAAKAVQSAIPAIAAAAVMAAETLRNGGQIVYAAAGSSALMALADALEIPGTYGIAKSRIKVLLAGGLAALSDLAGAPEDDADAARAEIVKAGVKAGDCVIAVTASGQTPFPMAAVAAARAVGAKTVGMANNAGAALFELVDIAICLPTPPEVIAGSTRMGAATAQKIALNMVSTMMAVHLGHVHDGYMVNLQADNIKLRDRARRIVMAITGVDEIAAAGSLELAQGAVKTAIILAAGAANVNVAQQLLTQCDQRLRPALAALHHG